MIKNLKTQSSSLSSDKNISTKQVFEQQNFTSTKNTIGSQNGFSHQDQLSSQFESNIFEKMLCSSSKLEETNDNYNFCQSLLEINKKGRSQQRTLKSLNSSNKRQTKNGQQKFQDTLRYIDFPDVNQNIEKNSVIFDADNDDDEEEYSIWDDSQLKNCGVDINSFVDLRGHELTFYQLYRLRSSLFQTKYQSRLDTIQEVQTIFSHLKKEAKLNDLKNQQIYLDQFYLVQSQQQPIVKQMKELHETSKSPVKQQKICQTNNNQQLKFASSSYLTNNSEFFFVENQNPYKFQSDFSQTQSINKKNKNQRRQKVSIDQKLVQKLKSLTIIPDKLNKFIERSQYQGEEQLQPKIKLDQQTILENQTSISSQNLVENQKVPQQSQKQLSLQKTTSTILSYLKKVFFKKKNEDVSKDINSQQLENLTFAK